MSDIFADIMLDILYYAAFELNDVYRGRTSTYGISWVSLTHSKRESCRCWFVGAWQGEDHVRTLRAISLFSSSLSSLFQEERQTHANRYFEYHHRPIVKYPLLYQH